MMKTTKMPKTPAVSPALIALAESLKERTTYPVTLSAQVDDGGEYPTVTALTYAAEYSPGMTKPVHLKFAPAAVAKMLRLAPGKRVKVKNHDAGRRYAHAHAGIFQVEAG
jgi:hypothetical protein